MRRSNRRIERRVAAGLVFALVAAGGAACGGDDEETTSSAAPAATSAAAPAESSAAAPAESSAAESAPAESSAAESAPAESSAAESAPAESSAAAGADPFAVTLKDGSEFKLSDAIKAKVDAGEEINYVFSYQSSAIQGFSQQYKAGFEASQDEALAIYPKMTFKAIAPAVPSVDVPQQIAQIKALLDTGQIDCLSIQPNDAESLTGITNEIIAKGIPVFTAGVTTGGNEFSNFTQEPLKEGAKAAQTVLDWAQANGKDFKVFAVSGGLPSAPWAQGRMQGFREAILAAIPDANFVTTEKDALDVSYEPAKTLDAYKAFLSGAGKDVQVIVNVDIGAGFAGRAIDEAGKKGTVYSVGWNVTPEQTEAIKNDLEIALFDQGWPDQAGFGARACATFLAGKGVLPNDQELTVVTKENVDAVIEEQKAYAG